MSAETFYTTKTVGALIPWNPSERIVRQMVQRKQLPVIRKGRRLLFKHSDIINWLATDDGAKEKEAVK